MEECAATTPTGVCGNTILCRAYTSTQTLTTNTGPTKAAAINPVNSSVASRTPQTMARVGTRASSGTASSRARPPATAVRCDLVHFAAAGLDASSATMGSASSDCADGDPAHCSPLGIRCPRTAVDCSATIAPALTMHPGSNT